MGVLNLTPDSFSDGGKYNKNNLGYNHAVNYLNQDQILLMLEESLLALVKRN